MSESLATFVDRWTMRHVRVYPHPVERVWRAITDPAQVEKWFLPLQVDLRVGGRFAYGAVPPYIEGVVAELDPPRVLDLGPGMRYELEEVEGGCRMTFTQSFAKGFSNDPVDDDLGGDVPGGPDTPWRPGFVGGFHSFFDALGSLLDGTLHGDDREDTLFVRLVDTWLKRKVHEGVFDPELAAQYRRELRGVEEWNRLNEVYRKHIRDTIPPA